MNLLRIVQFYELHFINYLTQHIHCVKSIEKPCSMRHKIQDSIQIAAILLGKGKRNKYSTNVIIVIYKQI